MKREDAIAHIEAYIAGGDELGIVSDNDALLALRSLEYDANELIAALKNVQRMLASGRTVGSNWEAAALSAENYIIGMFAGNSEAA